MTPRPTLGQILRPFLAASAAGDRRLAPHQWKTLRALAVCRTAALGGQAFYCPHCRREHVVAHSCRNRHCPHCQGAAAVTWLEQQAATLLPVPYFHLVFTLPHALNGLIRQNRAALFKLHSKIRIPCRSPGHCRNRNVSISCSYAACLNKTKASKTYG